VDRLTVVVRNPGHVIVVPNTHVENMYAREPVGRRDPRGGTPDRAGPAAGLRLRGRVDPAAQRAGRYQDVWHYHLHVPPRNHGDDLSGSTWRDANPAERRPYADRLRAALAAGS
jgi:histidine triad (HIT) family protein